LGIIRRGVIDRFSEKKYGENVVQTVIILVKPTVIVPDVVKKKVIEAYEY